MTTNLPYHGNLIPFLIGIAGPSCAGKSELARRLAERLAAQILPLDCYYRDLSHLPMAERCRVNFDAPEALDERLLIRHVGLLAEGREIARPVYDFKQHVRTSELERVAPAEFVILEGLFTLHWEPIRRLLGIKIFVEAPHDVCLKRRLERDVRERGCTPESVVEQYERTVRPMADRYVWPTRAFADLVLSGMAPIEESVARVLSAIRRDDLSSSARAVECP